MGVVLGGGDDGKKLSKALGRNVGSNRKHNGPKDKTENLPNPKLRLIGRDPNFIFKSIVFF